ncbi:MAG TPA: hypothetical protein VFH39_04150 [Candidatus Saccharimonadales bacterium]|nr:hypothetical protein [Candidatus Saccharimonadales bacterium]
MITPQLDTLPLKRQAQGLRQQLNRKQRLLKRSMLKSERTLLRWLRSQYYPTAALRDCRQAVALNEDIMLAVVLIGAVICFSAVTILANIIFTFASAAYALASVSSFNLSVLTFAAIVVLIVLLTWIGALLQNSMAVALMEGMNHKQNRSLRVTLRRSLRFTSRTAAAWLRVLSIAVTPFILWSFVIGIAMLTNLHAVTTPAFLIAFTVLCGIAVVWLLGTYSLLPFVMLFEPAQSWIAGLRRSRQLVLTKGRLFIMSSYLLLAIALSAAYGLGLVIQWLTPLASTPIFILLALGVLGMHNAVLTMLYRKRKLARK